MSEHGGPFKKGHDPRRNVSGRPKKGLTVAGALEAELLKARGDKTNLERMAEMWVRAIVQRKVKRPSPPRKPIDDPEALTAWKKAQRLYHLDPDESVPLDEWRHLCGKLAGMIDGMRLSLLDDEGNPTHIIITLGKGGGNGGDASGN
jgi:hypothetical protein